MHVRAAFKAIDSEINCYIEGLGTLRNGLKQAAGVVPLQRSVLLKVFTVRRKLSSVRQSHETSTLTMHFCCQGTLHRETGEDVARKFIFIQLWTNHCTIG